MIVKCLCRCIGCGEFPRDTAKTIKKEKEEEVLPNVRKYNSVMLEGMSGLQDWMDKVEKGRKR